MRRLLISLLVVLLVTSCATRSDRVTVSPSIPTSLVPNSPDDIGTGRCTFTIGSGLGAVVSDVVVGGPSEGALREDDLIVGFGGDVIRTSADLVAAVQSRSAGDTVTVAAIRDGQPVTAEITLGASAEGRTLLGVIVTTVEDQIEPDAVVDAPIDNPLARPVSIAGGLWMLDPTGITWSALRVSAPAGAMMPIDGDIYTVEVRSAHTATLINAVSGQSLDIDLIEWDPVSVIGTLGHYALIGAERTDADGAVIDRAVIAIDPIAGSAVWAWITDPTSEYSVPIIGHRSLDGSRILVGLGTVDNAVPVLWVLVSEAEGQPVASVAAGIPDPAAVLGWHDADRVIAIVGTVGEVALIDPDTGTSVQSTMPVEGEPTGLWPVGDGEHILVEDGLGLVLATVGDIDRRVLTDSCGASLVADLGWVTG
jgi:hypothetical protein